MSLTKEAIQHIQNTAIQPDKRVVHEDDRTFIVGNDGYGQEITRRKTAKITLNTLTSMVDFIKNIDFSDERKLYLKIDGPREVYLISSLQDDNSRDILTTVEAILPSIQFDNFKDAEILVIELQAKFMPTDDRETVLQVLGNLKEENVKNLGDDGVSQQVVIKQGVASASNVKVPNPVVLAPFRTFHEVKQPASPFIFRMREGGQGALFEADGQGWKLSAIQNIKAFFEKELAGLDNVVILA